MKRRILSFCLALCMLLGMLPTDLLATVTRAEESSEPVVSMEALLAETEITVNGAFSEPVWSSWTKIPASTEGAPSGGVAAAWDLEKLYLAINSDAEAAELTVNEKVLSVALSTGTVTGVANAIAAAGSAGAVEIAIPLTSLGIVLTQYDQSVGISCSLSDAGVKSYLAADKLILSGKVAAVMDLSDDKKYVNVCQADYTSDGAAVTLQPTGSGAYFIREDETINLGSEFVLSYNLEFNELPNYTNVYNGTYNGFTHRISAADKAAVIYGISYPSEATGLLLAVRSSDDTGTSSKYEFPLNRGLNEKFQLTCAVHTDGSADFFVDGDYLGTVENAVFDQGLAKTWFYWMFANSFANNSSFTISDVKMLEAKYVGNLPVTTGDLEALVAETAVQVDGSLSEPVWSNWKKVMPAKEGAPRGGVAAAWDLENLYLAINTDADTVTLTLNDTALTVDVSTGTVNGAAGTASAIGSNGVVELSIPWASLGIVPSKYEQVVTVSGMLSKNGIRSPLAADKLILSGKVAAIADYTSFVVGTDLLFLGCDYSIDGNATTIEPTSGTSYFIDASHTIDLKSGFQMSYDLEFTELAVVAEPSYAGAVYKGFSHFVMAADTDCVYYCIYRPSEDGDLMLAVMHDAWTNQSIFPLNRGLNEKFQLTFEVYPDQSVAFFVDGQYLGTVKNAVVSQSAKSWSYWRFTDPILGKSSFTISPNTVFTQEGETVTMKASPDGKDNYFLYQSDAISMAGEFLESYNLKITGLPVATPTYSGGGYTGFNHYFVGAYENTNNETKRVMYGIYRPSEDSGLMLVVRGNMGIKDFTFDLNRDLGEEFRLSCLVHADGSADFFVDGDYLGTVKGAVSLVTGFGKSMSLWRYKATGTEADVQITVSRLGRTEQKYASLANMLKISYILGRSLSKVTGNLDLPSLLPNSEILGDIPITWQTSDASVLAADGTVTRHEIEVKAATLTLLYNGQVKDTAEVTIAPLNVVEYPGTDVLTVGFAGTPVVMDGSVAEEGWAMHGRMVDAKRILVAEFGAQWDADYLYLAVDTVTKGVPFVVTLNGNAFHISGGKLLDSNNAEVVGSVVVEKNSVVEIKIPVAALGLTDSENDPITRIAEYDYKVAIVLTVKDVSYEGTLHLSRIDWWAVENRQTQLPVRSGYANTIANGGGAPDGDQGVEKVESGYRFYDLYSNDGSNPASVRSYVIMMNEPVYDNFGNRPVATQVNFDFVANALPVYDNVTGIDESQNFSNYGFSFWWSEQADGTGYANIIFAGILGMEDGLYFVMSDQPVKMVKLNRQIGESFNVGMTWETNGDMVLSIDGEEIYTFAKAARYAVGVSGYGQKALVMNVNRNTNSAASSADDIDVIVRNFAFGYNYNQGNLLRTLDFGNFRGENPSQNAVSKNLGTLPAAITGYGPLQDSFAITWTSSNPEIVTNTGVVTVPESGAQQVTLTATVVDDFGRTHIKDFDLIVSSGEFDNSNVLYSYFDVDPANTPGLAGYASQLFTFDATNNSIVAVLETAQQVNVVVLKDIDDVARLSTQNLSLWVSNDNETYTRVENFKLLQVENKWYLYDFSASAKYVKVHYTHYDNKDSSFTSTFEDMITADYHEVFGGKNAEFRESTYTLTNSTGKTQRDYAFSIAKSDLGITGTDASIRLYLDGELLYHYVDDDAVYVRIKDLAAGASVTLTVKQSNDENVMDIANKEAVYEVTYGTIETRDRPTGGLGRWMLALPAGTTFPDGSTLEQETIFTIKRGYSTRF